MNIALCHQKNSARWLDSLVDSVIGLVDHVFIIDDHSDEATISQLELLSKTHDSVVWETRPLELYSEKYNEKVMRHYLFSRSVELFGWPEWVIYLDGDECLSPMLHIKLAELFSDPSSPGRFSHVISGWEHLVGSDKVQALNRRIGRVGRIWTTAGFPVGYPFTFHSLVSKSKKATNHISPIPEQILEDTSKRVYSLFPVEHFGFWDDAEMTVKRYYHNELFTCNFKGDKLLLEEEPKRFVSSLTYDWDLHSSSELFTSKSRVTSNSDASLSKMEFPRKFDRLLVCGFEEQNLLKVDSSRLDFLRLPVFPFMHWSSPQEIRNRGELNFISLDEAYDKSWDYIVVPKSQNKLWTALISRYNIKGRFI